MSNEQEKNLSAVVSGKPHEIMPLVTVAKMGELEPVLQDDGRWSSYPFESGASREVEAACKFPRYRYFFAGRPHPDFGDIAFAYGTDMEKRNRGKVNPFDTGGLFLGYFYPLPIHAVPANETVRRQRACDTIRKTRMELGHWRGELGDFLQKGYKGNHKSYLYGHPPQRSTIGADLPARYEQNQDWRAWTWEIQIHSKPPLEQGLIQWSSQQNDKRKIFMSMTDNQLFSRNRQDFLKLLDDQHLLAGDGEEPCDVLQAWIIDSVERWIGR